MFGDLIQFVAYGHDKGQLCFVRYAGYIVDYFLQSSVMFAAFLFPIVSFTLCGMITSMGCHKAGEYAFLILTIDFVHIIVCRTMFILTFAFEVM
uniref:Uncharacterized protein n=1 Tax=Parascaris equorum TaxID=6256 RepID=A0A914RRZ0_PAREQ